MRFYLLWFVLVLETPGLQAQDQRLPTPNAEELKKATAAVRELFKKDFAASDRAARRSLSKRLLAETTGAKDDLERYALLTESVQAGIDALDPWSSFRASDVIGKYFQIDLDEYRVAIMNRARKIATSPEDAFILAEGALSLWDGYMTSEGYDRASFWAKEAEAISKATKDPALTQAAREMSAESLEAKKAKEKAEAAIVGKVNDPAANQVTGIYFLVYRADAAGGIPFLAKGPAGPIRDAASKEEPSPTDPEAQADLAINWLTLSNSEKNPSLRRAFQDRSRYWKELALKGATGITRTKLLRKFMPPVTISKAMFAGSSKGDVTKTLQEFIDKTPGTPLKYDEYLAGDLMSQGGKTLTIDYSIEGTKQRGTITLQPGEITFIPPVSAKDVPSPPAQFRYNLIAAFCGAGARFTDVTAGAKSRLPDAYTPFDWNLGSVDPNPGQRKTTVVVAELHGRRFVRSIRQDEVASMIIR